MKVEYQEETSVRKALTFEVEAEVVDREIEARARDYAKKAKIPGFRPGKIPTEVVKKRFRQQMLEEVAEKIVNKVVFAELEGRGLRPLAMPKVTDLKIDEKQPLTFRAVFETLPVVQVPDYKQIPIKVKGPKVSEEEIDAEVDRMREDAARFDPVEDRPAQMGDHVMADLAWEPKGGGKRGHNENALIEIGGQGTPAELNEALIGLTPGQQKEVDATVPGGHDHDHDDDHDHDHEHDHEHPPQTVHYALTLKSVKKKVVPAADDEFAKDLNFDSLVQLRASVSQRLQENEERRAKRDVRAALIEDLVVRSSFEVPESLVERHMNARTEQAARSLAMQGIDPRNLKLDWQKYREGQREAAVKAAKADIILDEIARLESVQVQENEVEAEVSRYAERLGKPRDVVRAHMEKEGDLSALRARIREDKTLDLLEANARIESE